MDVCWNTTLINCATEGGFSFTIPTQSNANQFSPIYTPIKSPINLTILFFFIRMIKAKICRNVLIIRLCQIYKLKSIKSSSYLFTLTGITICSWAETEALARI